MFSAPLGFSSSSLKHRGFLGFPLGRFHSLVGYGSVCFPFVFRGSRALRGRRLWLRLPLGFGVFIVSAEEQTAMAENWEWFRKFSFKPHGLPYLFVCFETRSSSFLFLRFLLRDVFRSNMVVLIFLKKGFLFSFLKRKLQMRENMLVSCLSLKGERWIRVFWN